MTTPMSFSSGTQITANASHRNYESFCFLSSTARSALEKAIQADEAAARQPQQKRGVLPLYERAVSAIEAALKIKPANCPVNRREEVSHQIDKLQKHLSGVKGRIVELAEEISTSHHRPPSLTRGTRDDCDSSSTSTMTKNRLGGPSSMPGSRLASRATSNPTPVVDTETSTVPAFTTNDRSRLLKGVNQKFGDDILLTLVEKTDVRLAQIQGNDAAKRALEESVIFPALNPQLFTGLRAPCKGILLYGPPGNGKTMIAKAVANEAKSIFFNVSAATIMSKWVGEGEKLVQTLFQIARNGQPAIIFIDEVDSLLCERHEGENGASRRVKTEFLQQFEGCTTNAIDRVLVLGATNRPQDLDDGVLRRFTQRIFIDLPDADARATFMQSMFREHNTPVVLSAQEFEQVAAATNGYSFSDLMAVCKKAAMQPLQQVRSKAQLSRMSARELRPVNYADMMEAVRAVHPSTNVENLRRLREFAKGAQR